ncbi:MAG: 3-keto-disaccharide hydrolase [Chitinophagaceae bacterium]
MQIRLFSPFKTGIFYTLAASLFFCIPSLNGQVNSSKQEWIPLFNGKDINDWFVKIQHHETGVNYGNTFRVEEGIIKVRYDQYDKFNEQFGHLYFKQPFSYYHLKLEYRFTGEWRKDAPEYTILNSGVMYHSQDPRTMPREQDWPISVEMQFLGGLSDGKPRSTGNMCSPGTHIVYNGKLDTRHCIDSRSKTYTGDQWVKAELIVLGDSLIKHIINGDTVLQYSQPQIGGAVVNRFDTVQKQDGKLLNKGFIALQSEGQPVDFRNIELLNLEGCMDRTSKSYKSYYIKNDPSKCR